MYIYGGVHVSDYIFIVMQRVIVNGLCIYVCYMRQPNCFDFIRSCFLLLFAWFVFQIELKETNRICSFSFRRATYPHTHIHGDEENNVLNRC